MSTPAHRYARPRLLGALVALVGCLGLVFGAGGVRSAAAAPVAAPAAPAAPAAAPAAAAPAAASAAAAAKHTVSYDGYSFLIDGKRVYLWSGEVHYFRLPSPDLWLDIFQKMKAAGFNSTSLYFDWGYHSGRPGSYDFTGVRDVDKVLDAAEQAGLYVVARPAAYINAEVDGGGFPGWLQTTKSAVRSADPTYLKYQDQWQKQIDAIIAKHQITNGGGSVIGYQIENEFYDGSAAGRTYMSHLETLAKADGITVPLTGNHNATFASGAGKLDVDGVDAYPQGFNCSQPEKWNGVYNLFNGYPAGVPKYTPEFQGGAFDPWGGPGYPKCAQLINDQFADVFYQNNIANGSTAQSFYMTYGGTSWGWSAIPQNYTSYDYGAAITEGRQLDAKYYEDKLLGYFTQAVAPLTKTDPSTSAPLTDANLLDTARTNPDTHTQFHAIRHKDSTSTANDSTHVALDLGADGSYASVPQQPGTSLDINGRASKILVADYALGDSKLQYSTSEIMTHADIAGTDTAVLYGDDGTAGETVLRSAAKPTVKVLSGSVASTYDSASGDLRLNYTHHGLARVLVSTPGHRPLLLLLASKQTAETFWRADTLAGPVLVRGTHLLRSAVASGSYLALTGDTAKANGIEIFSGADQVSWNGRRVQTETSTSGSRVGVLPIAAPVTLPALTTWKHAEESPETATTFDDSSWQIADHLTTNSNTTPVTTPVLFADDYGFHTGNTWYRGTFTGGSGSTASTGITLTNQSGGNAGTTSVWLNGTFVGSADGDGQHTFTFPSGSVSSGRNVVAVLTVNMGHDEAYGGPGDGKKARGLLGARLVGAALRPVTWRLQGTRGGEDGLDPVRGPLNTGGLYGERAGWSLPGFPDSGWSTTTLPATDKRAGVSWYRTETTLDTPKGQDTSVALRITDNASRKYRAEIYVNGWQLGNYINNVGPEHTFPIPNGVLDPHGKNSIAIAVWNTDATTGGLGKVSLVNLGSYLSPLKVGMNDSPRYSAATYRLPAASTVHATLSTPDTAKAGETFAVTGTVRVDAGAPAATDVTPALTAPKGWKVSAAYPVRVSRIAAGGAQTFRWTVTAPTSQSTDPGVLTLSVSYQQRGVPKAVNAAAVVGRVPPLPPAGKDQVSDLQWLSSSNGWGPVERDTSNGEAAAGDGKPITIGATTYTKGLGTNSVSDVAVYTGGHCSMFTATVGVDAEKLDAATVSFSVVADGKVLATTPTLRGSDGAKTLSVDVTGAQVVDLVVGDGGDGNGNDHADWANPTLTCS